MRFICPWVFTAIALFAISAPNAYAIPLTFEFEATITRDWYPGVASWFATEGDRLTGRFSFESDARPGIRNPTNVLFYPQDINELGVDISLGAPGTFSNPNYVRPNGYQVAVRNGDRRYGEGQDWFLVQVSSTGLPPGTWPPGPLIVFQIALKNLDGSLFSSESLPTHLSLDDFDEARLRLGNGVLQSNQPKWILDAEITELRVVPEPSALLFVGLGLAMLSWRRTHVLS